MTIGLLPWEESPDNDKLTWIYVFRTLDLVFRCLWSEVSKPNHSCRCLWNVSYITCITITGSIPLVEQELLALPKHLSSPRVFSGVRVTRSLVLCVCFVYCCLSFFWPLCCLFFFGLQIRITPLVSSNPSLLSAY